MTNFGATTWGLSGLVVVAGLAVGLATMAGCGDDDEVQAAGGAAAGGEGGNGAMAGSPVGHGGAGAGGQEACVCGSKVSEGTIPLACACDAGLCTTFADDVELFQSRAYLGEPYYVLLGNCDDGYRTLGYEEATEQGGQRTYDADGRMVYDRFDGISPSSCASTIGNDPSRNCTYCLVTAHDEVFGEGAGGAGGGAGASGTPFYPQSLTAPCNPALLE